MLKQIKVRMLNFSVGVFINELNAPAAVEVAPQRKFVSLKHVKDDSSLLGSSLKTGRESSNTNTASSSSSGNNYKRGREDNQRGVNDKDIRFALAGSRERGRVVQDAQGGFVTNKKGRVAEDGSSAGAVSSGAPRPAVQPNSGK